MFGVLLWKEIRNHLMTFRFGAALITTFVLVVISVWVLGDDYIRRRDSYNQLAESAARAAREVTVPSMAVPVLHHPPSPLSIFAQGEEKHLGNSVEISRWEVPRKASDSLTDNMLLAAQPPFDLLAIFTLVVSLFGVLLSYDSVSGERERGTLKMLCSSRTSRGIIFAVKFLGGLTVLSLPFLVSFLSALIVLQFVHGIGLAPVQWLAVAAMVFTGLLFGALFVAVGLMSSALVKRSSTALVFSLLLWTLGVPLIPATSTNLVSLLHPLPPSAEIANIAQVTSEEINDRVDEYTVPPEYRERQLRIEGGGGFFGQSPWLFDGNPPIFHVLEDFIRFHEPLRQERAEVVWEVEREHEVQMERQVVLASWLSSAAPATHLRNAFTALAGTGYSTNRRFMENARRYRHELLERFRRRGYFDENVIEFFSRLPREVAYSQELWEQRYAVYQERENSGEDFAGEMDWRQWEPLPADIVPAFRFESSRPEFEAALWPIAILAFMAAFAFAAGFAAFIRYDVR